MGQDQDGQRSSGFWQDLGRLWHYYRGWKWLVFIGLSLAFILSGTLVFVAKTTSVDTLQAALKSQTEIYDVNDQYVDSLTGQKGSYVDLDQISPIMLETVIATEDQRFYDHQGFDIMGMGRALVRLLVNRDTSGGGGSTVTQQLAKNAFLTLDQTLQRKLKEFFLALEIEKEYSKDQILEMYLNHAYFGNGVWGVEDASLKYFGHSAIYLDYNQSAVLTGMLKGPSLYNPIDDYEAAIDRRNTVLQVLHSQSLISDGQLASLEGEGIYLHDAYGSQSSARYPYYYDAVISEAIQETHIPESDLVGKGYKIYTHLNVPYQDAIDQAYSQDWMFPHEDRDIPLVQSASLVIQPDTGGVAALVGGRGDYVHRGFNRAVDMRRSPGSTIKPLAVFVPALEAGYTMHSMVPDIVRPYGPDNYAPENYNHYTEPGGETPLYYALAQSKNTSAVHLLDEIGIGKSVDKLASFGIHIPREDQALTLALGALTRGVTLEELTSAYSSFANQGIRVESSFIRRIEDANGRVIYENKRPAKHMVMTSRVAADMTSMMLDSYGGYGTGYGAGPDLGLIAGKTGSTEVDDGNMNTRDRWMVGYTPDFVITTWIGLDEEGDQSLDELMPEGMGALFNQLTSQLVYASPQTPFTVTYASQMTQDTNSLTQASWEDEASWWLDQAGDWATRQAGRAWTQIQEGFSRTRQWLDQTLN